MSDEKDRDLPARQASSLMGQLVRQRQGTDVQGGGPQTNMQGQGPQSGMQGRQGPTGVQGGGQQTGVAGGGHGGAVANDNLNRADLERLDRRDDDGYSAAAPHDPLAADSSKFQANVALIREREKLIIDQLRRELDTSRLTQISEDTQAQVRARIREIVNSDPAPLTMMEKGILLQNVLDEIFGFGPLGPLLRDPSIGDICVNGPSNIYVERHGRLEKTTVVFENDRHLRQTIDKIIQPLGRRLDDNSPMVDARLPNGSRVNATIPPVSIDGPTVTIRCFGTTIMSLGQLVEKGAMSLQMAEVLKACVKGRINLIISGGTGSGKTTLLNALSAHINPRERIITIEDAAELRLQHEHWIRMETRPPNIEGKGQITQRMLVINTLRMRPDRIILGECRGEEAFDMLQAMNTGHE
ncbi:MAG TPA: CpaF family protein, partial [Candidatus Obscuribacterales bacterium]